MRERWIGIEGWKDLYEVSNLGRVRSLDRTIFVRNPHGRMAPRTYQGRVLRAAPSKNGYPMVSFTAPGRKAEYRYVHELVASHFLGPRPPGLEVCHRTNTRSNCREDNLRWGTRSSNALDRHAHGTMNQARGEVHFYAKLTEDDVKWIRANKGRVTLCDMAEMFGVHHGSIWMAQARKTWKHVS